MHDKSFNFQLSHSVAITNWISLYKFTWNCLIHQQCGCLLLERSKLFSSSLKGFNDLENQDTISSWTVMHWFYPFRRVVYWNSPMLSANWNSATAARILLKCLLWIAHRLFSPHFTPNNSFSLSYSLVRYQLTSNERCLFCLVETVCSVA